jgi:hypothetical protein
MLLVVTCEESLSSAHWLMYVVSVESMILHSRTCFLAAIQLGAMTITRKMSPVQQASNFPTDIDRLRAAYSEDNDAMRARGQLPTARLNLEL